MVHDPASARRLPGRLRGLRRRADGRLGRRTPGAAAGRPAHRPQPRQGARLPGQRHRRAAPARGGGWPGRLALVGRRRGAHRQPVRAPGRPAGPDPALGGPLARPCGTRLPLRRARSSCTPTCNRSASSTTTWWAASGTRSRRPGDRAAPLGWTEQSNPPLPAERGPAGTSMGKRSKDKVGKKERRRAEAAALARSTWLTESAGLTTAAGPGVAPGADARPNKAAGAEPMQPRSAPPDTTPDAAGRPAPPPELAGQHGRRSARHRRCHRAGRPAGQPGHHPAARTGTRRCRRRPHPGTSVSAVTARPRWAADAGRPGGRRARPPADHDPPGPCHGGRRPRGPRASSDRWPLHHHPRHPERRGAAGARDGLTRSPRCARAIGDLDEADRARLADAADLLGQVVRASGREATRGETGDREMGDRIA